MKFCDLLFRVQGQLSLSLLSSSSLSLLLLVVLLFIIIIIIIIHTHRDFTTISPTIHSNKHSLTQQCPSGKRYVKRFKYLFQIMVGDIVVKSRSEKCCRQGKHVQQLHRQFPVLGVQGQVQITRPSLARKSQEILGAPYQGPPHYMSICPYLALCIHTCC